MIEQNEKIPLFAWKCNLLKKAIEKYGTEAQIFQCVEELNELATELMHHRRDKTTVDEICSEIADVEIMILQMRLIFGDELVDKYMDIKLKRLEKRLND